MYINIKFKMYNSYNDANDLDCKITYKRRGEV